MRILLINARFSVHFGYVTPPLGLIALSAYLKRAGYSETSVLHLDTFPPGGERLEERLLELRPDVVGISAMTAQAASLHTIAGLVKKLLPGTMVLAGGAYPTHYPEACVRDTAIDAAVLHEGELTLLELVRRREQGLPPDGVAGICLNRGGKAVRSEPRGFIEDLDSLPFPDWDALDIGVYRGLMPCSILAYKQRYMSVMNSRGCPYRCTYCHNIMGKRFRAQSPGRVLAELRLLHDRYGVNHVEILDDIANFDPARFKAILRGLAENGPKLKIYLASGVRGDLLDEESVDLMPAAGVVDLTVAVETASPRLQKVIRKDLDLEKVKRIIAYAAGKRIYTQGLFMLGFPGETAAEMFKTLRYAASSRLHSMMIATCFGFKGTELGDALPEGKAMAPGNDVGVYEGYSSLTCSSLKPWQLKAMKFLINLAFYYNPARLWRIVRDLPNRNVHLAWVLVKKLAWKSMLLR